MSLSHFLGEYGNLIMTVGAGVGGWCANMMNGYLKAQRQKFDAGQQALAILDRASERDRQMDTLVTTMTLRVNDLMLLRWRLDDVMQEVYAQAIAARMIVHELDAQAKRFPRDFAPLPAYPLAANGASILKSGHSEQTHDAG
ncbi:hypothetical protein PY793_04250 [Acetobacter fabarum]|uniref:hypothetical protein n=1 Tax=Acetobacter fabarum TaxID=483199 RepID=UPI00312B7435